MSTFNTSKFVTTDLKDLTPVISDVQNQLTAMGYEVRVEDNSFGAFISISKGGIFKSILGMKTSLNVEIKTMQGGILLDAKVGIFGQQVVPSLIMLFVAWPVLLTQITGLVQQSKLDDEVLGIIEQSIYRNQSKAATTATAQEASESEFCFACGKAIPKNSAFCPSCGTKQ